MRPPDGYHLPQAAPGTTGPSSPGGNATTDGRREEEDEDKRSIRESLSPQLISLHTMSRPLRIVAVTAFVQLGVVALLLATDGLPQPQVPVGISSNFPSAHLPL